MSDLRAQNSWRTPGLLLQTDPPVRAIMRAVLDSVLSARAVQTIRGTLESEADDLVGRLVSAGSFDAVTDFAEAYPLWAFADAVGISEEGRENLLPRGGMTFNGFGPRNGVFDTAMEDLAEVREWSRTGWPLFFPVGTPNFAGAPSGTLCRRSSLTREDRRGSGPERARRNSRAAEPEAEKVGAGVANEANDE